MSAANVVVLINSDDSDYRLGQHCAMVTINRRPGIVRDEIKRAEEVLTGIGPEFARYQTPRNYRVLRGYYNNLIEYEEGKD
jgi:hypothetical protein